MSNEHALSSLWRRDVPAASDLTFVLATLQRIEKRRFHRDMLFMLVAGVLATLAFWLYWPSFAPLVTDLTTSLPALSWTPSEWSWASLAVMAMIYIELRWHRS